VTVAACLDHQDRAPHAPWALARDRAAVIELIAWWLSTVW